MGHGLLWQGHVSKPAPAILRFVSKAAAKRLACVSRSLLFATGLASHAIIPADHVTMLCMCGSCMHSQFNKAKFAADTHLLCYVMHLLCGSFRNQRLLLYRSDQRTCNSKTFVCSQMRKLCLLLYLVLSRWVKMFEKCASLVCCA